MFTTQGHILSSTSGTTKATTFTLVDEASPRQTSNPFLPLLVVAIKGTTSRVDHMVYANGRRQSRVRSMIARETLRVGRLAESMAICDERPACKVIGNTSPRLRSIKRQSIDHGCSHDFPPLQMRSIPRNASISRAPFQVLLCSLMSPRRMDTIPTLPLAGAANPPTWASGRQR